ncbi:MAG: phosphate signaling complex protein PhoU [Ilumatobacter sp.]|nr:phosphate signaling complex protein PhoU [Ilumatobacter sp.]
MTEAPLRGSFHSSLDEVRDEVVRMCAIVTEMIPRATDAFLNNDLDAAQRLIDDDDLLDAVSVNLDTMCTQLLALQQPMATDLREIVAAIRLNPEIERSGDLVVNIAKATRRMFGTDYDPRIRGLITKMSEEAQRMFRLAGEAYAGRDVALGAALDDIDDRLDDYANELITAVLEDHRLHGNDPQTSIQMALLGRFYERVGDHAVNVGEWVRYIVEGWTPEHAGAERARNRSAGGAIGARTVSESASDLAGTDPEDE